MIEKRSVPRTINPQITFNALVEWFYKMATKGGAPGFLIGLSGTDSLISFCAASKALEKAGKPNRMMGIHFAPSEDFLYDHPEAEVHLWFRDQVLPWLREQSPNAEIVVDTSIDWRCDGLRWGSLMDLSVVSNDKRRMMRLPEEQYWVVGTRNRTETLLLNYSNISMAASMQPIVHLWKSEVLQISEHLGIPQIAISKSCETDCICGRQALASNHIREVDTLLMVRCGELSGEYTDKNIPEELRNRLDAFIKSQVSNNHFKKLIPYTPRESITWWSQDPLVLSFEAGTLNLKEFNHYKHLYIAWCYLKDLSLEDAIENYAHFLGSLLEEAGQSYRFNLLVTRKYFMLLEQAMNDFPTDNFDELIEKSAILKNKIPA